MTNEREWVRVLGPEGLAEGRVATVVAGSRTLALSRFEGSYGALDNHCPHQGGPLGEGSIENGWLRCPWHGWDFHPCTGRSPGSHEDGVETFPVDVRDDGIWVSVPADEAHVRTVSDVLAETFVAWGVTHVFGMVGHSNLGMADAIRRRVDAGELTYVGIRHEGAAAFAASAYAKLTGRPAACLTIAGPGATNLLTGLWDARVDRAPVLALTGQVDTQVLGPGAFQEIDLAAAFAPVTAWSRTVLPSSRHAELANLALKHAILQRDVTHLILPDEVQVQPAAEAQAGSPEGRLPDREIAPPAGALAKAEALLHAAKRPVIIVGHGARFAMEPILALAERLGAPILTTFKAKGQVSDHHPLGGGVLGRSGTPIASYFMNESDVLLVFGASFSNHTGITPKRPIIQVDFEPMAHGKSHPVAAAVLGEIGVTARLLLEHLPTDVPAEDRRAEMAERWRIWREEKARRENDDRGRGVASAAIFAALARHVPDDAVIAVDVGNNTYSFGRYFECTAQSVLMSGYLGSIGFGFPAAMGAWAAAPDRKIVCIAGDGGFGQYLAEFTTAVRYGMNITLVVLSNDELGKISKEQRAGAWPVWETSLANPDFARYAELCGGLGIRVESRDELEDAFTRALASDGPALVEDSQRRGAGMKRAEARSVLHYAALLVAAVGKDLLPPEADASHKALAYDPSLGGFTPAGSDQLPFQAFLRIGDLTLRLVDRRDGAEDSFALVGRTLVQAESWLNDRIRKRWPEAPGRVVREVYDDLPPHAVAEGGAVPAIEEDLLGELERFYAVARTRLEEIRDAQPRARPIRIWPHHFDEAVLLPLDDRAGEEARSIGIGFSPGDGARPEPYWYVTPWPYPPAERLPADPAVGRWQAEPFFGATLTASAPIGEDDAHSDSVRRFLSTALSTARELLGEEAADATPET